MDDELGIPAEGSRRTGCVVALVGGAVIALVAVLLVLAIRDDEVEDDDRPCDQLAVELAYLEAIDPPTPEVREEITANRARQDQLGCEAD